ncbi:MAG: MATE family efflux transporter [Porphyromonas sp.]|nr:MATE family efflux transporter [Porphyromonas sp.]
MRQTRVREVKNLTEGPISKPLTQLALPILGTSFVQMLYSFVDMAWLGRLGSEAVAATGAASVFVWIAQSLSLVNKVGCEVSVAHAIGRGEQKEGATYSGHGTTLGLLMGSALMLLYLLLAGPLLGFYQLEPHIHDMSVEYLRIVSLGLPLLFMLVAFSGTYNATGHSKVPFTISTISLMLNIILDPIFIFVLDLGVRGAALATVIAQVVGILLFLWQMLYCDQLLGGVRVIQRLRRAYVLPILRVGGPVALMNSLFAFINMSLGRFASQYGGHIGVLSLTTGGQMEGVCWNTAQGFSTALSSFVSQNYGAGKLDRAKQAFGFTLRLALSVGIAGFFLFYFGGERLFSIIVPEPEAYVAGAHYLRIQALAQLFSMLEITCQGFFYGIRRSLPPALISMGGNLLRIPLAIFLMPYFGSISTLWWIIAGSSMLKGLLAGAWYLVEQRRLSCALA